MELPERIIRTVAYFDLFDYPLTKEEIRRWLFGAGAVSFAEIETAVSGLVAAGALKEEDNFVCAADREGLPALRAVRAAYSARKWRRARRWSHFFAALPGVELVGVGNTLAYGNAKDGSDIDLFIVVAPGNIWRTRFFCAALAAAFNLRPRTGDNRDKLCLSFFVTTETLDISKLKRGDSDVYMDYWIRLMKPLAATRGAVARWRAANPGALAADPAHRSKFLRVILSPLGLLPGAFAKRWQQRHFPQELRQAEAKGDGSVVISDSILKFHVNDRRRDIYERWVMRVDSLLYGNRQDHTST